MSTIEADGAENDQSSLVEHNEFKDLGKLLAKHGIPGIVAIIAAFLGLSNPATAAGLAISGIIIGEGKNLHESYQAHRNNIKYNNLKRLIPLLYEYIKDEVREQDNQHVDLFFEVVNSFIEDDEEAKTPIYAGILEWMIKKSPDAVHVRIVSDAARSLSYFELYAFLMECHGKNEYVNERRRGMEDSIFWRRIVQNNLSGEGARTNGSPTSYGNVIKEHCHMEELEMPTLPIQLR